MLHDFTYENVNLNLNLPDAQNTTIRVLHGVCAQMVEIKTEKQQRGQKDFNSFNLGDCFDVGFGLVICCM